ncbi:MAG: putative intraflagellar transport protein 25 [Streblomastix strix]|uniref:Putative intraflagellar transport protein 25 n=1 Tax=Streblomastix strix TaxID=222440 RepID=A0A5J4WDT9_9EUKA|nr:MAG: putative intraflagellar transport protein 25 [Streblomastix strix]
METAQITLSTSNHSEYPPEAAIDNDEKTFYVSTGTFPQVFIITFASKTNVQRILLQSTNIRELSIEYRADATGDWQTLYENTLDDTKGQFQNENKKVTCTTKALKVIIKSGYAEFVSIHKFSIS